MLVFLCFTVFGVKEPKLATKKTEQTSVKDLVRIIFKNDQLLVTAIAMALFMIGYCTTTGFGLYYFKYAYGDEGMYSIFALILGVSQIFALAIFPALGKRLSRKKVYAFSTALVVAGYIIVFFAPTNTMLFIGIAGLVLFIGQAFIQVMMLMFLTDSVEYGEWKFHKRNDSVTFSLQPFINKMGGAVSSGVVGAIVIALTCIVTIVLAGYFIYRSKYILHEEMYEKIVRELNERK